MYTFLVTATACSDVWGGKDCLQLPLSWNACPMVSLALHLLAQDLAMTCLLLNSSHYETLYLAALVCGILLRKLLCACAYHLNDVHAMLQGSGVHCCDCSLPARPCQ